MDKIHIRFTSATKFIILIFTVCLIYLFHKINNENSKEEFSAVNVIIESSKDNNTTTNEIDEQTREWISKRYPKQFRNHYYSRLLLTQYLIKAGIDTSHLRIAKEWARNEPFSLLRFEGVNEGIKRSSFVDQVNFSELIAGYKQKVQNKEVFYVSGIDTALINFNYVQDELRKSNEGYLSFLERMYRKKFSKEDREEALNDIIIADLWVTASLSTDTIILKFNSKKNSQRSFDPIVLLIPATVNKLDTSVCLFDILNHSEKILPTSVVDDLSKKYGQFPVEVTKKQVTDKHFSYFDDIDILGFKIPYQSFFLIVFFFEILFALSLANSLYISVRSKWWSVMSIKDDDLFEPLIENKILRGISWLVIPVASLYMAIPSEQGNMIRYLGIGLVFVFYLFLYIRSIKLERGA